MAELLSRSEAAALKRAANELALSDLRPATEVDGAVMARHADSRVLIQVKSLATVRHEDLLGRLAVGVLSMSTAPARGHRLVVVAVPHVSASAVEAVRGFMDQHAGDVQWMLVGENGDLALHAPKLGITREASTPRRREHTAAPSRKTASQPFSDLNSWMLKVLLLRDVPAQYWSGPRRAVRSASELAEVARVSEPHAYRFLRTFREMDFARTSSEGVVVVRRRELIAAWLEAVRLSPPKGIDVQWSLGKPSRDLRAVFPGKAAAGGIFSRHVFSTDIFSERQPGDEEDESVRVALAGFEACRALKVLHTEPSRPELYVSGDMREACERLDLEPCDERDAHFTLLSTKGASVFRGAIEIDDDFYCADILQAALDVSLHPARGREQAEHIIGDVLGWEIDR
jgi:hypothetical protein